MKIKPKFFFKRRFLKKRRNSEKDNNVKIWMGKGILVK